MGALALFRSQIYSNEMTYKMLFAMNESSSVVAALILTCTLIYR